MNIIPSNLLERMDVVTAVSRLPTVPAPWPAS